MKNDAPKINSLHRSKNRLRVKDTIIKVCIGFSSVFTVAMLVLIIGYILIRGLPHVNLRFLTTAYSSSDPNLQGILPMIINTLYMIVITLLFSVPVGLLTAIYLTQYAKQGRLTRMIRFTTSILAGIPSIIFGLFGALFFGVALRLGYSILCGCLTLTLMVLPTIIRTSEEALLTVPGAYIEGALALGARKLRVIFQILLPNAMSGILSAIILAMGRIVGESAALIFTAGMVYTMPKDAFSHILDSGRTLTLHLYQLAMLGEDLSATFATAAVLLIIVFLLNLLAGYLAKKVKKG